MSATVRYLDYDGEAARVVIPEGADWGEGSVLRGGKWVPIHWSELFFKCKDATAAQMAEIKKLSTTGDMDRQAS